jgi:hypothetical protein
MMTVQRIILVTENLIVGRDEIARRIGYHPNDIPFLVRERGLKAWRNPGEKGIWKARPEDLDEFNRHERDAWLSQMGGHSETLSSE